MKIIKKLSKELPFILEIESLKSKLDKLRPLTKQLEDKVLQKLRLDWNYNSNAIEGNTFTFGETTALLMEGITAKGKPLKDALDIKGHNEAINFMLDMIHDERSLNEADIRSLHKLVLGDNYKKNAITSAGKSTKKTIKTGEYKTEANHVETSTGEIHYYATPEETPAKMQELVEWYNDVEKSKNFSPIVLAAMFHHKFVEIHPFDDGNGRMTRILTNFILLKYDYPVSVIKQDRKSTYYSALSQADNGEIIPIIEYIAETVKHSFEIYFKAINGEDINEPDDIDKEIALFRGEFGVKSIIKKRKKDISCADIVFEILAPLKSKLDNFTDIFITQSILLHSTNPKSTQDLRGNIFSNIETFKNSTGSIYKSPNNVRLEYNLINAVKSNKLSVNVTFSIHFRDKDYFVIYGKNKLTRYYDDVIITDKVFDLWKDVIKDVINQLKEIE